MPGASAIDPTCPTPLHMILHGLDRRLRLVFPKSQGFSHDFLPARITPKEWQRLTRRAPWVGLGWTGLRPDAGGTQFTTEADFFLLLATKNVGAPIMRFTGDALGPGLFNMVHLATVALQGFLVRDAGFCAEGSVQVGTVATDIADDFLDEDLAIAQLQLAVRYQAEAMPGLDEALDNPVGDFAEQALSWSFVGGGAYDDPTPTPIGEAG